MCLSHYVSIVSLGCYPHLKEPPAFEPVRADLPRRHRADTRLSSQISQTSFVLLGIYSFRVSRQAGSALVFFGVTNELGLVHSSLSVIRRRPGYKSDEVQLSQHRSFGRCFVNLCGHPSFGYNSSTTRGQHTST